MKHIISIGINKVNGLTPLGAAVSGAKEFVDWGNSQGYTSDLFSDEAGNISQAQIFDKINEIIEKKACEQLIVFFSGHGILKSPSQEIWLLSDARNNPNESINLTGSIDNARTSGIPYIIFISDACRVLPHELQLAGNGSVIFPICNDTDQDCAIDILYATRPGNPAFEQNSQANSKKNGLFTQALLEILNGHYPETIRAQRTGESLVSYYDFKSLSDNLSYKSLLRGNWHINTINSESSLKYLVSQKARSISITLKQTPDIRIQYQDPKPSLAEFDDNKAKNILISSANRIRENVSAEIMIVGGIKEKLKGGILTGEIDNRSFKSIVRDIKEVPVDIYNVKSNLIKNSELIFDSQDRLMRFETFTGFTIIGTEIDEILVKGDKENFRENNGDLHIRIPPNNDFKTALIILKSGESLPVAILDGYIGTLIFEKNRLLSINYSPSITNWDKHSLFRQNESLIRFVHSFVASAANEGFDYSLAFRNEFPYNSYMIFSTHDNGWSREYSDPSLSLYLAYAFKQEGKLENVKSIYEYIKRGNNSLIFDIALLADKLSSNREEIGLLAPFCPMIAIGWAYRQQFDKDLSPIIKNASNYLVPNLWTTFDKKGTEIIKNIYA